MIKIIDHPAGTACDCQPGKPNQPICVDAAMNDICATFDAPVASRPLVAV